MPSATELEYRRSRRRAAIVALTAVSCLALAALAAPRASAVTAPSSGCAAVNIITARASTESPGEGITGSLVTQIVDSSTQTVSHEAVVYPATLTNYTSSESQGVTNAEQELTTAVQNCPNQKEVLLGYSQGAQVSMDVVAGNAEVRGTVGPVSTSISSHVVAIANFGDPGHVVGEPWDLGTSTRNGIFPRSNTQIQRLVTFGSSKIASWCDFGDPYCASGANLNVHLTYLDRYQNAAASFVLSKIGG
ncbi:MAG TPA: cutinase family protein [Streptosporangiaceae bacterium]|nr:cutinase family protein [Streptosporangiaceae bacterium]